MNRRISNLPQSILGASGSRKSLFRDILQTCPLDSKIWKEFFPKSMILKDQDFKKMSRFGKLPPNYSNAVRRKLTSCHPSMYLYGVSPMV